MIRIAPRTIATAFTALLLSVALALPASAEPRHGIGPWHGKGLERMAEALDLTDSQREQIAATMESYRPQLRELHRTLREHRDGLKAASENGFDEAAAREHAEALGETVAESSFLMARARADVHETLTAEQREKLATFHERMRDRMQHRRGNKG